MPANVQISPATVPQPQNVLPSFDCSKAKSVNEKLICGDSELSALDSQFGEIYRQAKTRAIDKNAFNQQAVAEWKLREANCQEKACLTDWYARRKAQLLQIAE